MHLFFPSGASGGYTATGTSYGVYPNGGGGACYNSQSVQQAPLSQTCDGNRPAPGLIPTNRGFALMPHPYKAGSTGYVLNISCEVVVHKPVIYQGHIYGVRFKLHVF